MRTLLISIPFKQKLRTWQGFFKIEQLLTEIRQKSQNSKIARHFFCSRNVLLIVILDKRQIVFFSAPKTKHNSGVPNKMLRKSLACQCHCTIVGSYRNIPERLSKASQQASSVYLILCFQIRSLLHC